MLWLTFLKAFVVGGAICLIGQIIINWTHLTNGKILVIFHWRAPCCKASEFTNI